MSITMNSAFSCELSMKAICLTRTDRARMNHDLWSLYRDLPEDSRTRLEKDFPEVGSVLKEARHTFGKWRYFEVNVGGRGMKAMIDTERASALAKAARVLLDEAELMGLGYSVNVKATQERTTETRRPARHARKDKDGHYGHGSPTALMHGVTGPVPAFVLKRSCFSITARRYLTTRNSQTVWALGGAWTEFVRRYRRR